MHYGTSSWIPLVSSSKTMVKRNGLRHMTKDKSNFLSLTAFDGGRVEFRNGKSGTIVGVCKIVKSLSHSIDNVYLVDGL